MRRLVLSAVLAIAAATSATATLAATAPADAIKYRKAVMSAMAAHIGAFSLINFGRVDHPEYLKSHANALADLGAEGKVLFPAGTDTGDTDALPLIWQEQAEFDKLVAGLAKSTAELRDAVNAGDKAATMKAFKAVGESCKGCHDRFRKEQK
jgi:cytochrome c556